ncbi:hypothetical protein Tco_0603296 [Tanacetum coccineum]
MNIIKNHPLRFSIAASASVPWIYMAQFWHNLKEDGSKHRLKFLLDRKELTLTLDDFRTIFHLPHANDNNHALFVPPPSFSDMVLFYKQVLGFTMELKTISNFKISGLLQPWQTLCKIFSKCLTTRITGWDQPPLQIMKMLYCFVNNIHVDYAELMWEGIYYSLPSSGPTSLPYHDLQKIHHLSFYGLAFLTFQDGASGSLSHSSRWENYKISRENVALVYEHLAAEEIEKLVEDPKNVDDRRKGEREELLVETRIFTNSLTTRSLGILSTLVSLDTEKLQELTVTHPTPSSGSSEPKLTKTNRLLSLIKAKPNRFKRYKSFFHELQGRYGYLFAHLKKRFMPRTSSDQLADNGAKGLILERKTTKEETERLISKAILQEHGRMQAHISSRFIWNDNAILFRNSVKRQKISKYEAYVSGESSSGQVNVEEPGDEHQYHIDQMKNFLKSDIIWESKKEILVSPHPRKITPLVQSCQRDLEAPALSLINQDLLYLKKGNSGPEKILSLEIVARRLLISNQSSITSQIPSTRNKNDIEACICCIVNNKEPDYAITSVAGWMMVSISVHQEFSDMGKSAQFSTWNRKLSTKINLTAPTIYISQELMNYDVFFYCL